MLTLRGATASTALFASLVGSAGAVPTFSNNELNSIFFQNAENLYRPTADCTADTCFAADADNDPPGYQRVNTGVANNVLVNDIFAGILNIQNIDTTVNIWGTAPGDRFVGYFAQQVAEIVVNYSGDADYLGLTIPSVDPFNVLQAGESFRLYTGATAYETNGTTFDDITKITSNTFWASLGTGTYVPLANGLDTDGFTWTNTDLDLALDPANPEFFAALNIVSTGASFNVPGYALLNDDAEALRGGSSSLLPGSQVCTPADIGSVACTFLVGTGALEPNSNFPSGASPWSISSDDPFQLLPTPVPTPGSLTLLSLGLVGLGAVATRRRRRLLP